LKGNVDKAESHRNQKRPTLEGVDFFGPSVHNRLGFMAANTHILQAFEAVSENITMNASAVVSSILVSFPADRSRELFEYNEAARWYFYVPTEESVLLFSFRYIHINDHSIETILARFIGLSKLHPFSDAT